MQVKNLKAAREVMKDKVTLQRSGSIAIAFQRAGKQITTYPTMPPSKLEVRVNHVHWMCESKRPFALVSDNGYHRNMKHGRPHQYIPDPATVSRDVRAVFVEARGRIARLLRVSFVLFRMRTFDLRLTRNTVANCILRSIAGRHLTDVRIWQSPYSTPTKVS